MNYNIRKVNDKDEIQVIDIFNYYIENSFAAFLENKLSYENFQALVELSKGYPFYVIENDLDEVVGFGFLGRYHPAHAFNRVAELSYFLMPAYTQKGLGSKLLNILTADARELGIDSLLANINSLNKASLNFHLSHGFIVCGRFARIGKKQGTEFDVVWMQKFL